MTWNDFIENFIAIKCEYFQDMNKSKNCGIINHTSESTAKLIQRIFTFALTSNLSTRQWYHTTYIKWLWSYWSVTIIYLMHWSV